MRVQKMIEYLKGQIVAMEESVAALEKLEAISTGVKKRGRPPLPRCAHGCGRPVHRGKCKGTGTGNVIAGRARVLAGRLLRRRATRLGRKGDLFALRTRRRHGKKG